MRRNRLVEAKALQCPERISDNDCMLILVVIVDYLKRDWCGSLCCKRMFHMLWHSSYLQISAYGYECIWVYMNLCIEILALCWVYTGPLATATIMLRSWCQKRVEKSEKFRRRGKWIPMWLYFYASHMPVKSLNKKIHID